jgi:hypothetical protein
VASEHSRHREALIDPTWHQIMLVINGIHLLENLKPDELAAMRVHEFALVRQP